MRDNHIEILLTRRPANDPSWPNLLHTPGTVIRGDDTPSGVEGILRRIIKDELGLDRLLSPPQYIGYELHTVKRGPEMANIFMIDLSDQQVPFGKWYSTEKLPDNLVETQVGFIERTVRHFAEQSSSIE